MSDSYSFTLKEVGKCNINGNVGLVFSIIPIKNSSDNVLSEFINEFLKKSFKKYTPYGLLVGVRNVGPSQFGLFFDNSHFVTQEKSDDYFEMVVDFSEIDDTLKISEKELNCFERNDYEKL